MSERAPILEPATAEDAAALAAIHHRSLPDDFLPSLGLGFLTHVYYPAALRSPFGTTLIALAGGRIAGFVTVAHDSQRFTSAILRRELPSLGLYAAAAVMRDRHMARRCAEVGWSAVTGGSDPVPGEIVFIAADAQFRGRGIGTALIAGALDTLRARSVLRCRTKTLASNTAVIRLYQGLGWSVRDHVRLIGRDYVNLVSPPLG